MATTSLVNSGEDDWSGFEYLRDASLVWKRRLLGGALKSSFCGDRLRLRLNDFPEEPLYTLFRNGEGLLNFTEWPDRWLGGA